MFGEKLRVQIRFQETEKSFFVTQTKRRNCLHFFLKRPWKTSVLTAQTTKKYRPIHHIRHEVKVKGSDCTSPSDSSAVASSYKRQPVTEQAGSQGFWSWKKSTIKVAFHKDTVTSKEKKDCNTVHSETAEELASPSCDHGETGTAKALKNGCSYCLVRTVDSDVLVILIGNLSYLLTIMPATQTWVGFGVWRHFQHLKKNPICQTIGEMFYGMSHNISILWERKTNCLGSIEIIFSCYWHFLWHSTEPLHWNQFAFNKLQATWTFVVILYDKTCELSSLDAARKDLSFVKKASTWRTFPQIKIPCHSTQSKCRIKL